MNRRRALMGAAKNAKELILDAQKYYTFKQITTGADFGIQGCCAVNDKLFFVTISQDYATQRIQSLDLVTNTVTTHGTYTGLGHCNSMTYVPSENALFVATMDASIGVAVISLDDFTITRTFQIKKADETAYAVWSIAYDRKRNYLYSWEHASQQIGVFSTTGTRIKSIPLTDYQSHTTAQGMETDGDYFYLIWSSPANVAEVYTVAGSHVKTQAMNSSNEAEELAYDWNGNFYVNYFVGDGKRNFDACVIRTFDGWAQIAFTPAVIWNKSETGGSITVTGLHEVLIVSTAAASYNLISQGVGNLYSYSEIVGKQVRISGTENRTGGTGGQIVVSVFTTNTNTPVAGSDRLYQKSKYFAIPDVSRSFEYIFEAGGEWFSPTSDKYGTKIGYWLFSYSDSGNNVKVDLKIEVKLV